MSAARWHQKASAVVQAYRKVNGGRLPSKAAVAMLLCVAQHETMCGDVGQSWTNEGNWGGTTTRYRTEQEAKVILDAGVSPSSGKDAEERNQQARYALKAAGLPWHGLHGDSQVDSHGVTQPYFTFFFCGPSDIECAGYFVARMGWGAIPSALESGDPHAVAQAMYDTKYFTGNHPHPHTGSPDDAKNVDAYAGSIAAIRPDVDAGLSDWQPTDPDIAAPLHGPIPDPHPKSMPKGAAPSASPLSPSPSSALSDGPSCGHDDDAEVMPGDDG